REERAVLVGRPDGAVAAEEARAGGFFAAEADRAVEQSRREPFEADRDFAKFSIQAGDDAIDHGAADQRFADGRGARPLRAVREEVADGDGQVVVRVQEARGGRDDAVAVGVGIVGEGDFEFVFQFYEPGHRVRARAIHADLAVV